MNRSNLIIALLITVFHLTTNCQSIILINGEPVKVILDGTEIDTILSTNNQVHMNGFDTEVPDNLKKQSLKKVPSERAAIGVNPIKRYYITDINFNRIDHTKALNASAIDPSRLELKYKE